MNHRPGNLILPDASCSSAIIPVAERRKNLLYCCWYNVTIHAVTSVLDEKWEALQQGRWAINSQIAVGGRGGIQKTLTSLANTYTGVDPWLRPSQWFALSSWNHKLGFDFCDSVTEVLCDLECLSSSACVSSTIRGDFFASVPHLHAYNQTPGPNLKRTILEKVE